MACRTTELNHHLAHNIDMLSGLDAAGILLSGQLTAVQAVDTALPTIVDAALLLARRVGAGGRMIYCAAGSSGLMALADGLELPGTFGISNDRIEILFAGGDAALKNLRGGPEDDEDLASADVANVGLTDRDTFIVLSASGSTPYVVKALEQAKQIGTATIAIANNENTPLLRLADIGIFLPTPPEMIAGSTRMGAGSAQKVALNMMSTLMAIELGHVHAGHMVNVVADNEKLRERALGIVMTIADCDEAVARDALDRSNGAVKLAILLACGASNESAAKELLEGNGHRIRPSLSALEQGFGP